ncbi:MAG: heme anaerobic degradation radical SAM methyltransferase ChuW/HutW [Desulfobacterales bacterium]|nr:heme anaerobic degradation radical SAM methyltransferase ChuW/HutW [Desulfobacterales bacterium]
MKQKVLSEKQDANAKLGLMENFGNTPADRPYFANICDNPLTGAFDKKAVVHAGLGGRPVAKDDTAGLWYSLSQVRRKGKTVAYIHIPFCETRCLYCGFFANPARKEDLSVYARALIREMEADQDTPLVASGPVHAVYLGGGTPTALAAKDLKAVLDAVQRCLPLANDCEITVEGRVLDFTDEKMDACIQGGANRFSIGVQTFDDKIRSGLGRVAVREKILDRLTALKEKDQAAVIIDLIYGLPGQTMAHWKEDIRTFLDLDLDGVDLYQLIRFPGGALDKAAKGGRFSVLAGLSDRAAMFERGVDLMTRARYRRLSVSHWGRAFRERNLYNLAMKEKATCLAYGSGAGGNVNGHMVFQEGKLSAYLKLAGETKPVTRILAPPANESLIRRISGDLELGRMDLRRNGMELGLDLEGFYSPLLNQWENAGLVSMDKGWVTLTLAGQFWQTNLAQGMIDYFSETRAGQA